MKIRINGEFKVVEPKLTISEFVKELGLDETKIVVELNREVILKSRFSDTILVDNDCIELVEFVAGG